MKVTHIMTRVGRGGTDQNVLHLIDWQRRQGHDARLVVGQGSDTAVVPSWVPVEVVPELVRDPSPVADLHALQSIAKLVARQRPDVVHTHQSKAGVLGRAVAARRVPVTVHTIHMASFGPAYGRASPVYQVAERVCARFTDVLVAVGEEVRDVSLRWGVGRPEQYVVVRSPIRLRSFLAVREWSQERRAAERDALGVPARAPIVLSVGFLERRKRHDLLLRRLQAPLASGAAVLVLAGDGDQRSTLERQASDLGIAAQVRFLGHVDPVENLFAAADVLVHTSAVEGVPQVVLQALAAGVPVVATQTEGLREVAGAPVRVVDRLGAGLATAVDDALRRPPAPVAVARLEEWTDEAIEGQIARLHDRIEQRFACRGGG